MIRLQDFTINEHEPAVDAKTCVDLKAFLALLSALPQAAAQIWRTLLLRPVGPRPSLRSSIHPRCPIPGRGLTLGSHFGSFNAFTVSMI